MVKSNLINTLNRKYSETLGQLHYVNNVKQAIEHLTATIKLFAPDWTGEGIKPKRPYTPMRWAKRGIGLNALLEVLNEAKEPLTLRQLVYLVIDKLGMPPQDEEAIKLCVASFNNRLRKREGRSVMVIEGNPNRWVIKRFGP